MKIKLFSSVLILFCLAHHAFSQDIMELPLSPASGYSLFDPGMANLRAESEENPYKVSLTGIPDHLKNVTRHQYIADEKQFWHQNYVAGKMPKELYEQRMEFLKYDPDKDEVSEKPLKCFVYIIVGEDENGDKVWLADTDLDLDFSDEEPRPLFSYGPPFDNTKYRQFSDNAIQLKYQHLLHGKVVEEEFPFAVALRDSESILFNYPQHHKATVHVNGKTYHIAIQSGDFLTRNLEERHNSMIVLPGADAETSPENVVPVSPNQYFHLGEKIYQYLGIDAIKKTAKIKSVKHVDNLKSAEVGFQSPDFKGTDFKTGIVVDLEQFKGKYILLDFWATWCRPCLEEFPKLKDLSALYDKSKFEIVGIIGDSKPENAAKLIEKYELTWHQILSDEIAAQYGVVSYPTTFLISPEGKITHKNIKGEALEKLLAELFK